MRVKAFLKDLIIFAYPAAMIAAGVRMHLSATLPTVIAWVTRKTGVALLGTVFGGVLFPMGIMLAAGLFTTFGAALIAGLGTAFLERCGMQANKAERIGNEIFWLVSGLIVGWGLTAVLGPVAALASGFAAINMTRLATSLLLEHQLRRLTVAILSAPLASLLGLSGFVMRGLVGLAGWLPTSITALATTQSVAWGMGLAVAVPALLTVKSVALEIHPPQGLGLTPATLN